jgi:hypothetical protein
MEYYLVYINKDEVMKLHLLKDPKIGGDEHGDCTITDIDEPFIPYLVHSFNPETGVNRGSYPVDILIPRKPLASFLTDLFMRSDYVNSMFDIDFPATEFYEPHQELYIAW